MLIFLKFYSVSLIVVYSPVGFEDHQEDLDWWNDLKNITNLAQKLLNTAEFTSSP